MPLQTASRFSSSPWAHPEASAAGVRADFSCAQVADGCPTPHASLLPLMSHDGNSCYTAQQHPLGGLKCNLGHHRRDKIYYS